MNSQRLLCRQKAGGIKLSGIQNILALDSKQYKNTLFNHNKTLFFSVIIHTNQNPQIKFKPTNGTKDFFL